MFRRILVFLILAGAAAWIYARYIREKPQLTWQEYSVPDGRFTVSFPAAPQQEIRNIKTEKWLTDANATFAKTEDAVYMVMYGDLPYDAMRLSAREQLEQLSRSMGPQRLEPPGRSMGPPGVSMPTPAKVGGIDAVEIRAPGPDDTLVRDRAFVHGRRMYQVMVITHRQPWLQEAMFGPTADEADRFFDSFKLQD